MSKRTNGKARSHSLPEGFVVRTKLNAASFSDAPIDTRAVYETLLFFCLQPANEHRFGRCTLGGSGLPEALAKKGREMHSSKLTAILNWLDGNGLIKRPSLKERQSSGAKKQQFEVEVPEVQANEPYFRSIVVWQSIRQARELLQVALRHAPSHDVMEKVGVAVGTLPEVPTGYPNGDQKGGHQAEQRAPSGEQRTPSGHIREGREGSEKGRMTPSASSSPERRSEEQDERGLEGEGCTFNVPLPAPNGSDPGSTVEQEAEGTTTGELPLPLVAESHHQPEDLTSDSQGWTHESGQSPDPCGSPALPLPKGLPLPNPSSVVPADPPHQDDDAEYDPDDKLPYYPSRPPLTPRPPRG